MDSSNQYSKAEIKSGFFVLVTIVLLLALTFVVGGWLKGGESEWKIRFGYLNGLEDEAPVYYAGREVGKVANIEIVKGDPRPIIVTVNVTTDAFLRQDSEAHIDTLGMMGEKFVELSPGTADSPELRTGTLIEGVDPIPMYVLITKMNLLADQMATMAESLNPLLGNVHTIVDAHKEEISKSVSNIHEVTANLRDMTQELKFHPWKLVRKG